MFSEIAPKYDRMNHLLSMNVDRYWRWRAVRKLAPNKTDPILDVCTGTGDLAFAFHRYTAGEVPVEIGKQKADRAHRDVQFVEADAQELPFADDHFQVVSAAFGLRNVADTDLGLREMTRVCKPGGKVAILEFSQP
ncbi:UNVERIFIED_CONTAM: hypothetical protein GTU68_030843, partial [Idotea baltica]|nr:hypothetical protein [Idotea baltica]